MSIRQCYITLKDNEDDFNINEINKSLTLENRISMQANNRKNQHGIK